MCLPADMKLQLKRHDTTIDKAASIDSPECLFSTIRRKNTRGQRDDDTLGHAAFEQTRTLEPLLLVADRLVHDGIKQNAVELQIIIFRCCYTNLLPTVTFLRKTAMPSAEFCDKSTLPISRKLQAM